MFRYRFKIDVQDSYHLDRKMIAIEAGDRNKDFRYQSLFWLDPHISDSHLEFLCKGFEAALNELLNKIATDNPNLHFERDLHEECRKLFR